MSREANAQAKIAAWLFQSQALTPRQKIYISFAFVSCLFSTAVCAPMGGSGARSVFQTKNSAVYWLFFFLSPILILFLCGRATYYLAKDIAKPVDPNWKAIMWSILGMWSGAINAYNTMEYIPGYLGWICFPFALCVPGVVNVPAIKEYHRRVFFGIKYVLLKLGLVSSTSESDCQKIQRLMAQSKRSYYQLSPFEQNKWNAIFSHRFEKQKGDKLRMLFNTSKFQKKHPITVFFAILGLIVGTLAQAYAYGLGREIGGVLSVGKLHVIKPLIQFVFGVGCAYLGIGMSGVACSDVFSEMSDAAHHWYQNRVVTSKPAYNVIRLGLVVLALAASASFVENQIRVMGQEGFWGKLLTTCAIISPCCLGYWAGNRVLQDGRYRLLSPSYLDCHERLERELPKMQSDYVREIARQL